MKVKTIVSGIVALLLIACGWIVWQQNSIRVTTYTMTSDKIENDIRIVQLTDLHDKEFGKDNADLLKKIEQLNPDVIVMTGDMINRDTHDYSKLKNFLTKVSGIAPCYYAIGNHEQDNRALYEKELFQEIVDMGVTMLELSYDIDHSYEDITIKDTKIRIGGKYVYAFDGHEKIEDEFLDELTDTDSFTVLLSHIPQDYFTDGILNDYPGLDVILTGHTHGGLVRIPIVGGLYAPEQGLFPEYDYGKYENEENMLIICAGLSGESIAPRINNRPEIVVLDLKEE